MMRLIERGEPVKRVADARFEPTMTLWTAQMVNQRPPHDRICLPIRIFSQAKTIASTLK